jgi:agmatinase
MQNYGGLSEEYTQYNSSDIIIIPVPYDGTSTWIKGADKGPEAILEASANMELYDIETDSEVYLKGIHTTSPVTTEGLPEDLAPLVKTKVFSVFRDKKFPVVIGGEHSVSIGAIQAAAKAYDDLTILQIDAHADLRDSYEGTDYNHACVMARAKELAPIVQVGIRSMSVEEKENMEYERVFFAKDICGGKPWMEKALSLLSRNVYITIDLDVFDPAYVPATGTPEPGGLSYYSVLDFLRKVNKKTNIIGFDVVELCPAGEVKASDFLATKLIYQLLSYKYFEKK